MKKKDRVINQQEINDYVKSFHTGIEKIDRWLDERVAKTDIPNATDQDTKEPYMHRVETENGAKFRFVKNDVLDSFMLSTIDFLANVMVNDPLIEKAIGSAKMKSLQNLKTDNGFSSSAIGAYANKWQAYARKEENYKNAEREEHSVKTWDNGYKMVALSGVNAVRREGDKQKNCLAGKSYLVSDGKSKFYSLRDKNDNILATLYVHDKTVIETKGGANEPVSPACKKFLTDFVKENDLKVYMDKSAYDFTPVEKEKHHTFKSPIDFKYSIEQTMRYNERMMRK